MFFLLSKILYFLIQPINWVLGLMVYALFVKKPGRKKKALLVAVLLTVFFTNRFIVNEVFGWWEMETITAGQIHQPYEIGILLGGYSNQNILPNQDRYNFSLRANRFLNAYELYRTGKIKKLLLTGGSGAILEESPGEALEVRQFLLRLGIPDQDIILENSSRNTYENAVFTKKLLDENFPGTSFLLITSAYHMRRSLGCFKKAGVECTPFSVDFLHERRRWAPENAIIPDRMGFYWWEILVKEWVGCLAYTLKGYMQGKR